MNDTALSLVILFSPVLIILGLWWRTRRMILAPLRRLAGARVHAPTRRTAPATYATMPANVPADIKPIPGVEQYSPEWYAIIYDSQ